MLSAWYNFYNEAIFQSLTILNALQILSIFRIIDYSAFYPECPTAVYVGCEEVHFAVDILCCSNKNGNGAGREIKPPNELERQRT